MKRQLHQRGHKHCRFLHVRHHYLK
nr:hypothetical protein [Tanacetum cinerariifolium]